MTDKKISFANDIAPFFKQYRGQMMWRFDLTSYEDVKHNAELIYGRISSKDSPMPPSPFPPLRKSVIEHFKAWMDGDRAP